MSGDLHPEPRTTRVPPGRDLSLSRPDADSFGVAKGDQDECWAGPTHCSEFKALILFNRAMEAGMRFHLWASHCLQCSGPASPVRRSALQP